MPVCPLIERLIDAPSTADLARFVWWTVVKSAPRTAAANRPGSKSNLWARLNLPAGSGGATAV